LEKLADRTADLAPVIAEIRAAGFVSGIAVARQLSARGIRPVRADRWSQSSVRALLLRLSLGRSMAESRQAWHAAKQRWIASLAPVLFDVRQSGHKTLTSIARELNVRGVSTFQGARWDAIALGETLKCLPEDQSQSIYLTRKEFASRLRPIVEELQAAGKTGAHSIGSALNARGIPGVNGGHWRSAQIHWLLKRLSMVAKRPMTLAEWLPSLAPIVMEVRAAGHLSTAAMVTELNARGLRACHRGRWTVHRLRVALREMRRYNIDYEPKEDTALATQLGAAKPKNPKRSKGTRSAKSTAFRVARRRSKSKRPSRGVRTLRA
jgi:hypothetical protein